MLLLDEPTNHLDAESVAWLEKHLKEYPGTVVAVTHDRYFLDNVAGWILELDRGSGIPWEGNYSSWLEQKQQRLALEEKSESRRQRTLQRELEWIRLSPRARQAKSKARLNAYEQLLNEDTQQKIDKVEIYIPPGPRLGDVVVEAKDVRKGFGDTLLIDDLNFHLPPGGIVGVIGPNGAGKTTLFRMITGLEQPDSGTLRLGETVKLGYVDQARDARRRTRRCSTRSPAAATRSSWARSTVASRAYVSWFNFKGRDQQKKTGKLSGGERNRVHLAKLLRKRLEPAAARRADQRPRRRHAAGARGRAARVRRLRRRHQPRPLVPRPHRHAHPRLRGRFRSRVVRGQLPGLRSRPAAPPRHGRRPAAPHQVPQADPVTTMTTPENRTAPGGALEGDDRRAAAGRGRGVLGRRRVGGRTDGGDAAAVEEAELPLQVGRGDGARAQDDAPAQAGAGLGRRRGAPPRDLPPGHAAAR